MKPNILPDALPVPMPELSGRLLARKKALAARPRCSHGYPKTVAAATCEMIGRLHRETLPEP